VLAESLDRRRRLASRARQPQLRVFSDRTIASRFTQTTPQSHKKRPMLPAPSSTPRFSRKISRPWRSPTIIPSRGFAFILRIRATNDGARRTPDARKAKAPSRRRNNRRDLPAQNASGAIPLELLARNCHPLNYKMGRLSIAATSWKVTLRLGAGTAGAGQIDKRDGISEPSQDTALMSQI
jgi:hypothetical protein